MRPGIVLIVAYAAALVIGGVALHRRGRRSKAVASRTNVVAHPTTDDWIRSALPALHTMVALVAAGAATLLPVVAVVVGAQGVEPIILAAASVAGLTVFLWLIRAWRRDPATA